MATTSSTLATGTVTGTAGGGRRDNGTHHERRTAGLLATAALGLSLLVGGAIVQGRQAAAPATSQASAPALAGVRPLDASTNEAFRWDFGQLRPVDAAVAAEYRWDFGGVATAGPVAPALAQGHDPVPADASTSAEYRWDFAR